MRRGALAVLVLLRGVFFVAHEGHEWSRIFCQRMIRMTRIFVRAVLVLWGMYTSRVTALPISSANVPPRWSNVLLYSELMVALLLRGESVCPGKHA